MHKCYSNCAYMHGYCSSCIYYFTFFLSLSFTSLSHFQLLTLTSLSFYLWSLNPTSSTWLVQPCRLASPICWSASPIQSIQPHSRRSVQPHWYGLTHLWSFLIFCLISFGFSVWSMGFGVTVLDDGGLMMMAGWVDGGCGLIVDGGWRRIFYLNKCV